MKNKIIATLAIITIFTIDSMVELIINFGEWVF